MRGSLVILAALCVIVAAAEASSVRFVSVDEAQTNGKDKKERNEESGRSDSDVKKNIDDVVKKINDGVAESEKTAKNAQLNKSAGNGSEGATEAAKKSAVPDKAKIQKRDVRRALDLLAKSAMKRDPGEETDQGWNIFNARKIIDKYLKVQRDVISKVTTSLIFGVEHIEKNQNERETLLRILNQFKIDMEHVYDNTIRNIESPTLQSRHDFVSKKRKFMRADELSGLMTSMNQRNPLALIPLVAKIVNAISGAATVADIASSLTSRSSGSDLEPIFELFQKLISDTMQMPAGTELSDY